MAITAGILVTTTAIQTEMAERRAEKVEKAQEKQRDIEVAIQSEQAARKRIRQISRARVAQAEQENLAATSGLTGSSAAITGQGAVASQAASNIGQINTQVAQSNLLTKAQEGVMKARTATPSLFENLVSQAAGATGNIAAQRLGTTAGTKLDELFAE